MYAIGLMSGTSLDGIDCVLCEIKGVGKNTKLKMIAFETFPLKMEIKKKIKKACNVKESTVDLICSLNFELGELFADCVKKCCEENNFPLSKLDFIASHGQTIFHLPKVDGTDFVSSTMQLGESSVIAYRTKCKVIDNFRVMDMAAGGEGAPLVPYSEYVLYQSSKGRILQNIGGIGNATVLSPNCTLEEVVAFDTGPGNMMIDEAMMQLYGKSYDKNGEIAASGCINEKLFLELMDDPYLEVAPPKSTGREIYGESYVTSLLKKYSDVKKEDIITTLTYFTAATISYHYQKYIFEKNNIEEVIIGGGGAHNKTLLSYIQKLNPKVKVLTQDELGYNSDAKEAIAFVVLGNETLHAKPSNVIKATGAKDYVILGKITPAPFGENSYEN